MVSFTDPIKYANQDFDEYQAACIHLGHNHAVWFAAQPKRIRHQYTIGSWFANSLQSLDAYCAVERYRNLGYSL